MTPAAFTFHGLEILSQEREETPIPLLTVKASDSTRLPSCPHCGSDQINLRGQNSITLKDAPFDGRRVAVKVTGHHNQCRRCRKYFLPPRPYQDGKNHFTPRLRQWILDRADMRRLSLATLTGLSGATVEKILRDGATSQPQG